MITINKSLPFLTSPQIKVLVSPRLVKFNRRLNFLYLLVKNREERAYMLFEEQGKPHGHSKETREVGYKSEKLEIPITTWG
jgi:Protein of unknown function (DUF2934)